MATRRCPLVPGSPPLHGASRSSLYPLRYLPYPTIITTDPDYDYYTTATTYYHCYYQCEHYHYCLTTL